MKTRPKCILSEIINLILVSFFPVYIHVALLLTLYSLLLANVPSKNILDLQPLFIFLQVFGGQIGMPLFVGTLLFAPSVKRHLTLVNFCLSWIIYSIVYCLT